MWFPAHLSVSSAGLDCGEVAAALQAAGMAAAVTPNITVQCDRGRCWRERGCRILHPCTNKGDVAKLWNTVRERFDLGCGHLVVDGVHNGCIMDFLRPTSCPGVDLRDEGSS